MANNFQGANVSGGTTFKSTDNTSVHTPHTNIEIAGVTPAMGSGTVGSTVPRVTIATDDAVSAIIAAGTVTSKVSFTRPADTTQYAANDYIANSTSSPTAGGLTFALARTSGKGGVIYDAVMTLSSAPATPAQVRLWLFDQAPTAGNDNATWALSDSDVLNCIGYIDFYAQTIGNNQICHVTNQVIGYTAVGSANVRGLPMILNAYTPGNAETIGFTLKSVANN